MDYRPLVQKIRRATLSSFSISSTELRISGPSIVSMWSTARSDTPPCAQGGVLRVSASTSLQLSTGATTGGVSSRLASAFADLICRVQPSRFARARRVPAGMPMLRAISRKPIPEARAVLICSQRSEEILLRGAWLVSDNCPFLPSFMFK